MATDGIRAADLHILRGILARHADKIDSVALFGSRATGVARANSDIDLVLYGALDDADIDRLWTLFDDSGLSVSVDPIRYSRDLYPPLRRHIDASAVTIFDKADLTARDA